MRDGGGAQRLASESSASSGRSRQRRSSPSTEAAAAGAACTLDVGRSSTKSRGNRASIHSKAGSGSGYGGWNHRSSSAAASTVDSGGLYAVEYLYALPPLFLAAVQRNAAAVKLLLANGAVPDFVDAVGRTPLHLSASAEFLSWPCAAAMVEYGARIRVRSAIDRLTAADLCPELTSSNIVIHPQKYDMSGMARSRNLRFLISVNNGYCQYM